MPGAFNKIRVYWDHDTNTWYAVTGKDGAHESRPLASTDLVSAESEAVSGLAASGFTLVSPWKDLGNIEAGALAVYAETGAANSTKASLLNLWQAHKTLLLKMGIDVATLTAAQRALLFSQDIMLAGVVKLLIDKGLITTDDVDTAASAVGAADLSWFTGT